MLTARWLGPAAALLAAIAIIRISFGLEGLDLGWRGFRLHVAADEGRSHETAVEVDRTGDSLERRGQPSRRTGKTQDRRDRDVIGSGGGAPPTSPPTFCARGQG